MMRRAVWPGAHQAEAAARPGHGRALGWIAGVLALLVVGGVVRANTMVADLSSHLIAITTAFSGSDVLLFGVSNESSDVAVVVRGPNDFLTVRRKDRIGGIWINDDQMTFRRVPAYFAVASSGPLDEIARRRVRRRLEIGVENLKLRVAGDTERTPEITEAFRQALIRNKQRDGLYSDEIGQITFLGNRLFRTTLHFPASVPPGSYHVQVFELSDGEVVGAQNSVLVISKIGLEADVVDFAYEQSAIYGIVAIVLALLSGWLASALFRNR